MGMGNHTAALVSCGSQKRNSRSVSYQLYESTAFQKSFAAATLVGQPYIMSAKHHLVSVDERLDPYDETLNSFTAGERDAWGETVVSQLPEAYDRIILFGGRNYVNPIKEHYTGDIIDVYEQCAGIGYQMGVANNIIASKVGDLDE